MDAKVKELNQFVIKDQLNKVQESVSDLLKNESPPKKILDKGLIAALTFVGASQACISDVAMLDIVQDASG